MSVSRRCEPSTRLSKTQSTRKNTGRIPTISGLLNLNAKNSGSRTKSRDTWTASQTPKHKASVKQRLIRRRRSSGSQAGPCRREGTLQESSKSRSEKQPQKQSPARRTDKQASDASTASFTLSSRGTEGRGFVFGGSVLAKAGRRSARSRATGLKLSRSGSCQIQTGVLRNSWQQQRSFASTPARSPSAGSFPCWHVEWGEICKGEHCWTGQIHRTADQANLALRNWLSDLTEGDRCRCCDQLGQHGHARCSADCDQQSSRIV